MKSSERKRGIGRKGFLRNLISLAVAVAVFLGPGMSMLAEAVPLSATVTFKTDYYGSNVSSESSYFDGSSWTYSSSPITSYLSYNGNKLMRVQYLDNAKGVLVEYYNLKFEKQSSLTIPAELPLFGGFYEMGGYYYLVTGQNNLNESDSVEVFRITKYDSNWKRVGSTGLYGANTTIPFRGGSLRMASSGKYLIIRTCHQMYKSPDGLNHQANVTIEVDTEQMKITDSFTEVANVSQGYVSHSFNQFVKIENNHIVAVDHGDAYPRSIVLIEYPTDISEGTFVPNWRAASTNVMTFAGKVGDNTTGAAVGGFEISPSSYLVVGNSVVQDNSYATRNTRNAFLSVVSRQTNQAKTIWLTNYSEGKGTTNISRLVKTSENTFMVLWEDSNKVYYEVIDGNGTMIESVKTIDGHLSNCQPIVVNGKVIWYTWDGNNVTFYRVSASEKYVGDVNTELQKFSYDESSHYLSGQIVVVEWVDVDGDGVKESTVPEYAPKMEFVAADGSENIEVFVTPTGTNTYYFDRLIADGLTIGKEFVFKVTSTDPNNIGENKTVPIYTGTSGIGESGKLGTVGGQDIQFRTGSDGTLLLYGTDPNAPYAGDVNSLLKKVECTKSDLGYFVSGQIIITEWINGDSTVPRTTPTMSFESYDGTEVNEVFMKCLDGTNTYYFDRNLNEGLSEGKEYIFRINLTEPNNVSGAKSMVATTNEMDAKEGILWETDKQIVMYKTVWADGDNQLRVYAINK